MNRIRNVAVVTLTALAVLSCAAGQTTDPLEDFEQLNITTVIDAPGPEPGRYSAIDRDAIDRGEYLVELLGCGVCHTNGAFDGAPDMSNPLAGSQTGIAWENPLGKERPGIVYPPNITPDEGTGIGLWSDNQIADAIVADLKSIKPIENKVPAAVEPGQKASKPFVYFGVYRNKQ